MIYRLDVGSANDVDENTLKTGTHIKTIQEIVESVLLLAINWVTINNKTTAKTENPKDK